MENCAVFCYNNEGELEQLSHWIGREDAEKFIDSEYLFADRKLILLQKIS